MPSVGAGILILETLESAQNRDAKIYAKILGINVNKYQRSTSREVDNCAQSHRRAPLYSRSR